MPKIPSLLLSVLSTQVLYETPYSEAFRPQFHYSPAKNWMNDPNGLFRDLSG